MLQIQKLFVDRASLPLWSFCIRYWITHAHSSSFCCTLKLKMVLLEINSVLEGWHFNHVLWCAISLGPILLVKLAKQSKIARFCQNVDAQWYCCWASCQTRSFCCGHSSWPTDVKGSANQDKDMKTGHYKERWGKYKEVVAFRTPLLASSLSEWF